MSLLLLASLLVLALGGDELAGDEVARVDGRVITRVDFERYLGRSHARSDEGNEMLNQLVSEALVEEASAERGLTVDEADVDASLAALESTLRAHTGGITGLKDALVEGAGEADLRHGARHALLLERLVRTDDGLQDDAPVDAARLNGWLAQEAARRHVVRPPLDEDSAASWDGGALGWGELGARLATVLPAEEQAGVLTEMIGNLVVRRRTAALGLDAGPAELQREILERQEQLRAHPEAGGIAYADVVQQTQSLSLDELVATPAFETEVLIKLLVERDWDEARLRSFHRAELQAALGGLPYEQVRAKVARAVRQRTYRALVAESTIARRF